MKPFAKLMMAVGILSLCSCSDDELSELNFRSDDSQNVESTTAFTPSYCYIWDINHLDGQKLALTGRTPVKATDSKGLFRFEQRRMDDGSMALVALLNPGAELNHAVADEVVITSQSNPEEKQTITLVLRDEAAADAAAATRGEIQPEDRFAEYFSRAYQLWGDVGYTPAHPVLKADLLKADALVDYTLAPSYSYKQTTRSSISEVATTHASKFGLSFTGLKPMRNPLMELLPKACTSYFDDFNIGGSLTKSTTKKQRDRDEYEYVRGTKEYIAASANLNTDKMERLYPDNYITLIDETFNDVLNNPDSKLYNKYGNDTTGIYNLLDYYGSYITTGGTFGASFEYLYSRKRAVTELSVEEQLCMELSAERVKERKINLDTLKKMASNDRFGQMLSALNEAGIKPTCNWERKGGKAVDPFTGKISYEKTDDISDYSESTESNLEVILHGGNCNTIGEKYGDFNAGNNPEKWWVVDYNFKINGNELPANFLPIYALCKEEIRKAALIEALTPVEDPETGLKLSPYVKTRHCPLAAKPKKSRIVLADFRACYLDESLGKRPKGYPKCKIMEGPDGKKRTYYCLAANSISNEIPNRQPFAIDIHEYVGVAKANQAMLFYYAFDYADQCEGFTEIDCMSSISGDWILRGDRTDKGLKHCASHEKYVCIKPAKPNTPESEKITGVAVWSEDRGWPISSTAGTTPDDKGFYGTYWHEINYNKSDHKKKALVMIGGIFQPCYLWLESTKADLNLRCTFEYDENGNELRPEIKMPDTWQ